MTTSNPQLVVTYGKWSLGYGKLVETYTEDEARKYFEGMEDLEGGAGASGKGAGGI